jgi:hypothetical protein
MLHSLVPAAAPPSSGFWLAELLVAAVFASLGYVGNTFLLTFRHWNEQKRKRGADLPKLQGPSARCMTSILTTLSTD